MISLFGAFVKPFQPTLPARGATTARSVTILVDGFQPTLPARGATPQARRRGRHDTISTHAPRTGSDTIPLFSAFVQRHFNPRSPHGERHASGQPEHASGQQFQPTLPARGATPYNVDYEGGTGKFQPTLPARGATESSQWSMRMRNNFNPRSPHGERHAYVRTDPAGNIISTHAPRTGSDGGVPERHRAPLNFNPRSPHGERRLRKYRAEN